MSHTHPTPTSSSFQLILDNALKVYKRRTKNDLLKHPQADRLQACDSPHSILTVLQEHVQELDQSQRSTKWLDPTVNVLHTFSEALGEGVGSVCSGHGLVRGLHSHICSKVFSPAKVIFIGFSVLLSVCTQYLCAVHCNTIDFQTAKDVRADQDTLFEMFERIEAFFRRLNIYTEVVPNEGMVDTITAIMVEVLNFIGMVSKEMMQGRTSKRYLQAYKQVFR